MLVDDALRNAWGQSQRRVKILWMGDKITREDAANKQDERLRLHPPPSLTHTYLGCDFDLPPVAEVRQLHLKHRPRSARLGAAAAAAPRPHAASLVGPPAPPRLGGRALGAPAPAAAHRVALHRAPAIRGRGDGDHRVHKQLGEVLLEQLGDEAAHMALDGPRGTSTKHQACSGGIRDQSRGKG